MRLAGGAAIHNALAKYFDADPHSSCGPAPSRPISPELINPGSADSMESFVATYELLRSKGYNDSSAADLAEAMAKGEMPMAKPTTRFAAIYGPATGSAGAGGLTD
jgi:hypothetical protein